MWKIGTKSGGKMTNVAINRNHDVPRKSSNDAQAILITKQDTISFPIFSRRPFFVITNIVRACVRASASPQYFYKKRNPPRQGQIPSVRS